MLTQYRLLDPWSKLTYDRLSDPGGYQAGAGASRRGRAWQPFALRCSHCHCFGPLHGPAPGGGLLVLPVSRPRRSGLPQVPRNPGAFFGRELPHVYN